MKEHSINKENFFIKGFYINENLCKKLINYFNNKKHLQKEGVVTTGYNPKIKKSTDLNLNYFSNEPLIINYKNELEKSLIIYKNYFPKLDNINRWIVKETFNIQKYKKKEAFYAWHTEQAGLACSARMLVFMTYLNTVKSGGETEWFYQKLKIKPEIGLTVFWPADWTHFHRGTPCLKEEKYIATGWYSFVE